jgi:ankyrin repeat protein
LWLAAANNELETTRLLLEHKANPLFPNESGSTPLHSTAASGGVEALQLLLDHVDVNPDVRDNYGYTPLQEAVFNGREGAVKLLIDRGDVDVNQKDNEGKWLLHLAVERGNNEITKMLCDKGIDLTGPGDQVMPLASRLGDTSTIEALMRAGVDPNKTDEHGWTPALLALVHDKKEALDVLLTAPGAIEPSKVNPLRPTLWAETDHSEYLELDEDGLTVKYKADPDSEDLRKRTALALLTSNCPYN